MSRVLRVGGLFFDGIDDYVQIPGSLVKVSTAITATAWINLSGPTDKVQNFVRKDVSFVLGWVDPLYTTFCSWLYDTTWRPFTYSMVPRRLEREWHFFGIAWSSGGAVQLYLDGLPDRSYPFSGPICVNDNPILLGREPGGRFGYGFIREVRIYNRALSSDEVKALYEGRDVRDGLMLYLPMDEGEGNVLYDRSGNNNHGTIYGATWVVKKAARVLKI